MAKISLLGLVVKKLASIFRFLRKILPFIFLALSFCLLAYALFKGLMTVWEKRWVQDDAFIAFRYAKNFAEGKGLVFNTDERVEGYTSFVYTLLIGFLMKAGYTNPVTTSQILGTLFYLATIITGFAIFLWVARQKNLNPFDLFILLLFPLYFLTTNESFTSYATGGLETSLFYFLIIFSLGSYYILPKTNIFRYFPALTYLLLFLTRPEGLLFWLVGFSTMFLYNYRLSRNRSAILSLKEAAVTNWPFFLVLGLYFAWKSYFYRDILPNTFYAKFGGDISFSKTYFVDVVRSYPILVMLAFISLLSFVGGIKNVFFKKLPTTLHFLALNSSLVLLLYLIYVYIIGADFMEYRFIVHIMPLLLVTVFLGILFFHHHFRFIALVLSLMLVPMSTYKRLNTYPTGGHPIDTLSSFAVTLSQTGKKLKQLPPETKISAVVAGAIPYYSELYFIDILGLTDKYVAHTEPVGTTPGHKKRASYSYLKQRQVNLNFDFPVYCKCSSDCDKVNVNQYVFIPLDPYGFDLCLRAEYLTPSSSLDRIIETRDVNGTLLRLIRI